jgi:tetratricopeptide (TPR) repeat protein
VRSLANTFVFDVHGQIESLPGATAARKTIVQTALVYLESLREDARSDPGLARDLAAAYQKVGTVQGVPTRANLGDSAGALVSLTHARELLTPLADRGDRGARRRLVSVDTSIALVKEANGDAAGAAESAARGQVIGEKLLLETPDDMELLAALSDNYSARARTAANRRDLAAGERAARRCLGLAERLVTLAPANLEYRDGAATAHNALGQVLQAGPALSEAIDHYDASIRIREQLVAESPNNLEFKRELMVSYGDLGDVLGYQTGRSVGDEAGAAAAFQKAIVIAEWARGKDPADHRARYDVAAARLRLGAVEAEKSSMIKDARAQLRQAQQICNRLLSEDPRSDRFAVLCATIDLRTGEAMEDAGRNPEAQQQFEAARAAADHVSSTMIKRSAMVTSAVHLAHVKAGQPDAPRLATFAARELEAHPVSAPFVDATLREALGRAYAAIAQKSGRAERPVWNAKAAAAFEDSLQHWRALKLAPAVEPQRAEHIALVEQQLNAVKKRG